MAVALVSYQVHWQQITNQVPMLLAEDLVSALAEEMVEMVAMEEMAAVVMEEMVHPVPGPMPIRLPGLVAAAGFHFLSPFPDQA
jgi:arginine/lysine/ornithine decarboxylase